MSPVTVGTMNFGGRTPKDEALKIVDRAFERGAAFFDTANAYGDGESERILGQALRGRRDRATIATKCGLARRDGKAEGLTAAAIEAACRKSLERLGTDYIDLYYLHAPDHSTPLASTLDGIGKLLEQRKVRAFGVSNFASWQILELDLLCDARGLPRPTHSQVLYNLVVRQLDVEYFAFTRRYPIHTTVYNPLAGGLLARTSSAGAAPPSGSRLEKNRMYRNRYWSETMLMLARRFDVLAKEAGLGLIALAYAWLEQRPGVHSILAGPGTVEHLDAALDGVRVKLPPEILERVDLLHREYVGTDVCYAR